MELDYLVLTVLSSIGNKDSVLGIYILTAIAIRYNIHRYTQRDITSRLKSLHHKGLVIKVYDTSELEPKKYPVGNWRITEKGREYLKTLSTT